MNAASCVKAGDEAGPAATAPGFAIPVPERPSLAISGRPERFPVRRIYCVGRNYLDHVREMGGDEREPPFFFQKPTDAIVHDGETVAYPPDTRDFQYEVEMVLAIGVGGAGIAVAAASRHVFGFTVGIDLTRRDLQLAAREAGRPWESGKAFDRSAPCGMLVPSTGTALPPASPIELQVNGVTRQSGDLAQMVWGPMEIVSRLSSQYELFPGDLIFTGTPAGVGPVQVGDELLATLGAYSRLTVSIGQHPTPA